MNIEDNSLNKNESGLKVEEQKEQIFNKQENNSVNKQKEGKQQSKQKDDKTDQIQCSNQEIKDDEDEDKKILMELIAQNNQKQDIQLDITNQDRQDSQISQFRMKKQPSESIRIQKSELEQHQLQNDQQIMDSIASLARKRYVSTEIDLQNNNINNQQQMKNQQQINQQNNQKQNTNENKINILNRSPSRQNRYAERAANLSDYDEIIDSNQQTINQTESHGNQQSVQQHSEKSLVRAPLKRSQVQYQSGLSSTHSLTIQRDFYIYFHEPENNQRNNSSNFQSYDQEEESFMMKKTSEPIKVPVDDLHEEATVQDAILSAVCQINNYLQLKKASIRLAYDENLYDLYLAKKNGEKKSLPALYPLEKVKKFVNQNMVLIPRENTAIIRSKAIKQQKMQGVSNEQNGKASDKDQAYNQLKQPEIIKEVSESMMSADMNSNTFGAGSHSFLKQKNSQSQKGNQKTRRSIQSTITAKQTKIGNTEEKDPEDLQQLQSPSKCFPFFCCVRTSKSSNKTQSKSESSNQSNNNKKNQTAVTS